LVERLGPPGQLADAQHAPDGQVQSWPSTTFGWRRGSEDSNAPGMTMFPTSSGIPVIETISSTVAAAAFTRVAPPVGEPTSGVGGKRRGLDPQGPAACSSSWSRASPAGPPGRGARRVPVNRTAARPGAQPETMGA
jgi:hypothetical protein